MEIGHRMKHVAWAILVLGTTAVAWHWQALRTATNFNTALAAGDYARAAGYASLRGRFAQAFGLTRAGRFDEAIAVYGDLSFADEHAVADAARFNLANAYLRRAIGLRESGAEDLAIPLLELAKHGYRELLRDRNANRNDEGRWAIRFNLELALKLLPDLPVREANEEINPERSSRAISKMPVEETLP